MLASQDVNSIEQQMLTLVWDDTIYRCFNEALRIAGKRPDIQRAAATIVELLHESFFLKQVMALRRLLEPPAARPARSVYSIPTLLSSIRKNHNLITRQNYVCYDGTLYDETDSRHDWKSKVICSSRHTIFDTLANTGSDQRDREDLIDPCLFTRIEHYLKKGDQLDKYANKFVAHAADPSNRSTVEPLLKKMSLRYLQDLYRTLIWSVKTIGKIIDQFILTEVSTPVYDQFKGWDNGFIAATGKSSLNKYWRKRRRLFDKWSNTYWKTDVLYKSPYGV